MSDLQGSRSLSEWLDDLIGSVAEGKPMSAYLDHALRVLPRQYEDELLRPGLRSKLDPKLRRLGLFVDPRTAGPEGMGRMPFEQFSLDGVIAWCALRLRQVENDEASMRRHVEAWCAEHPGSTADEVIAAARELVAS